MCKRHFTKSFSPPLYDPHLCGSVTLPGEMTTTSAGLLITLCLVRLTLSYDIFCNDFYNCQREALGEADYRYNPLFLQSVRDKKNIYEDLPVEGADFK